MRAIDIIAKKRDGLTLDQAEIEWFIHEYTAGNIRDYQAAALLMAVFVRGMSRQETVDLTVAMAHSGDVLDLSDVAKYCVDKHSSGGVGDKTSLVVLPLVAACGIPVAKMSGRGLGFSGGTLDKLESISGFRTQLSIEDFKRQARELGIVLVGQSIALAPADGKLYQLRDATATVQSLPLIASSIMSKKIAAGAQGIVLDVKAGIGAFMRTVEDASALAQMMVNIGADAGRDVIALISDMNQPLGRAVGNAVEVVEAVETLKGGGMLDFHEHCVTIAGTMLKLAGRGTTYTEPDAVRTLLESKLRDGSAYDKFRAMVEAQGGAVTMLDDTRGLPQARMIVPYGATHSGYVAAAAADEIAWGAFELGAGRETKEDSIDHAVGLEVHVKVGDTVQAGQTIATIHANDAQRLQACMARLDKAFAYSADPVERLPLFYEVFSSV